MTWLAFVAAFFKSLSTLSEKKILQDEDAGVYTSEISFVLAIVSLPLLFFVKNFTFDRFDLLIVYILSVFSIISSVTAAYVIKKLDVSESSILFSMSPIFISFLAVLFLKETLSSIQIAGILLSSFGLFVLEYHSSEPRGATAIPAIAMPHSATKILIENNPISSRSYFIYIIFFISLIFFSITTVGDRYVIHTLSKDPILYIVIVQFFVLFNFVILDIFFNKKLKRKIMDPKLLRKKLFWGNILFLTMHRLTHMFAVQAMQISVLNAVKQLAAVMSTIIGGKLFTEKNLIRRTAACLCVVGGVILVLIF